MMKTSRLFWLVLIVTMVSCIQEQQVPESPKQPDWKLCIQAWTFHKFTFAEALDKMKVAGVKYVEMFPDQTIGGGIEGKTHFQMSKDKQEQLKQLIRSKGLKLLNYGVVAGNSEAEWVSIMDFAQNMGIETILTEADSLQLNYIEPLCEEYGINVVLHNHPEPSLYGSASIYWEPTYTMQQIAKRGKHIGVSPDIGHWLRSGIDPMEGLGLYEGRIMAVHVKDLIPDPNGFCGYHDVPWGTGECGIAHVLTLLKQQGYQGTITLEYEYNWENSLAEVAESVRFFNQTIKAL